MDPTSRWIVLAQVLRPQGRKGEVLADLFTDFPERFAEHPRVWLAAAGYADSTAASGPGVGKTEPREAAVAAHWLPVGKNAGRIVLHFSGTDTIEQAERLAGYEVLVPLAERHPLDPEASYISDLVGCTVYDRNEPIGVVEGVEFPTTADGSRRLEEAAPLLAIASPAGDEILIPFAKAFILSIDIPGKAIRMELPEGLTQINLPAGDQNR